MKKKNYFNVIVILAVLLIPFMYSFFYLKAYWNPYGEGNIDNLPVAIINSDEGEKGADLIQNIKDSKKLKISVVSESQANDGLYNGEYYAVIDIPKDFTSSLESANSTNKSHATITYSPNQKSNYLASQIINNVVSVVEKNLDNTVNSTIIEGLEQSLTSVPDQLETINDGFQTLSEGTKKLSNGSKTLNDGTTTLNENYTAFHEGIYNLQNGIATLNTNVKEFTTLTDSINTLIDSTNSLSTNSAMIQKLLGDYTQNVNDTLSFTDQLVSLITTTICPKVTDSTATAEEQQLCGIAMGLTEKNAVSALTDSSKQLNGVFGQFNAGVNTLNTSVNGFKAVNTKIVDLQKGIETLATGANTLYTSSTKIQSGIQNLQAGSSTLNSGLYTLNTSVVSAKNELSGKLNTTKSEVKKVEDLATYSKEPVKVNTKEVNKVNTYGTAFAPFFISIALWVGCLMMFIVLYYDKESRFGCLDSKSNQFYKRSLAYHGLATLASILLGITLQLFLDFEITNVVLYYLSLILIANTFMAIMNFLIVTLNDVGKFIGLILLVLQLAAAGGTFPIETVTSGFRWLHPFLPMTYTNKFLKESLMSYESNLMIKYGFVVLMILLVFLLINFLLDTYRNKKIEK